MDLSAASERLMRMDEAAWRRHADAGSGRTRFAILPALALAAWPRVGLGRGAVVPVGLVIGGTWATRRASAEPRDFGARISRGVLGEQLWLERSRRPTPAHHVRAARSITVAAASGLPVLALGLWSPDASAVPVGLVLSVGGTMWFLDRIAWLHADLTGVPPGAPHAEPPPARNERTAP